MDDELARITPMLLRAADRMCRRRLAHEFESGRKLSKLGDRAFELAGRLTQDAITWHKGDVAPEHGFPDPLDLEVEERAVYRAASRAYVRMYGADAVEVHDLGWTTEVPALGVRLVGSVGIPVTDASGARVLRILRLGTRALIDDVEMRFLVLRAAAWAGDRLRIGITDLLHDEAIEYDIDIADRLAPTHEWLTDRVDAIRSRIRTREPTIGADCRTCTCLPGCPALTRSA